MEDDVVLRPGAFEYLDHAINFAPEGWDILLGGVYESELLTPINEYWNKTGEFCGLHFYIVAERAYEKILKYNGKHHIDRWMNHKGKGLNCYVTKKFIATQRDGFSDNVRKVKSYSDNLKRFQLL
jgi:hypothetical protein